MLLSICLSVLFVAVTANIRLYIDREPELIQNFITDDYAKKIVKRSSPLIGAVLKTAQFVTATTKYALFKKTGGIKAAIKDLHKVQRSRHNPRDVQIYVEGNHPILNIRTHMMKSDGTNEVFQQRIRYDD